MYNHRHPIEVTGKWSATEKALFDQAIAVYGWGNWQNICQFIPGRSAIQIKSHAHKRAQREPNLMLMKMMNRPAGMVHAHEKKGGPQALDLPQEYYNNYESQADMPIVGQSSTLSNLQGVHVTLKDLMNPPSSERCKEVSFAKNNQATTRGMSKHGASGNRMNTQAKVDYNQVANPNAVMIYPRKEEDTYAYEDEDMNNHTRAHMMRGSRSPNPNVPLSLTGNHHYNKLQATMSPVGQSSLFSNRQGVPMTLKDLTMNSCSELCTEVSTTHFDHDRMNSQAKVGSNQVTEHNNEMKINPLLQGAWKTDKVSIRKEEDTYEDVNNHIRAHMMRGSLSPNPNVPLSLTGKHHYNKLQATMSPVDQHRVFSDLQRRPVTMNNLIVPSYYSELEVSNCNQVATHGMTHLQKNHVKLDSNQEVTNSDVVMISPDASKLNSQTSVDIDKVSNRKEDDDASKSSAITSTSSNVDHTSLDINNHTSEDWFKMSEAFANGSGLNSQIKVAQVHGKDTNANTISDRNVGKYSKQEAVVQRLSIGSTVSQTSDNSNGETSSNMALLLCMLQRGQHGCGEDVDPLMQFCRKDTPMVEFNEITKYDVLSDFYDVYMNYVGNRRLRVFVQTRVSEYKSLSNNRNRNLFLNDFVQALPICRFLALDSSECKWRVMNDLFAFVAIREMFRELESEQKPTTPQDYEAAL